MTASILLAILACTAPTVDEGSESALTDDTGSTGDAPGTTGGGEDSAPYIFDDDSEAPDIDIAEFEAALTAVFGGIWSYNVLPIVEGYEAAMQRSTSTCPSTTPTNNGEYWSDNCTTANGASFSGYIGSYTSNTSGGLIGEGQIELPEGYTFTLVGELAYTLSSSGNIKTWSSEMLGTASWDGPEADGTWLAMGPRSEINLYAHTDPDEGATVSLSGSLLELDGLVEAVIFDGASTIYTEGTCPEEISGDVAVRVDGTWVDLFFDGPEGMNDPVDAGDCDGCGDAWARGHLLGEVCVDFGVLFDWGSAPF